MYNSACYLGARTWVCVPGTHIKIWAWIYLIVTPVFVGWNLFDRSAKLQTIKHLRYSMTLSHGNKINKNTGRHQILFFAFYTQICMDNSLAHRLTTYTASYLSFCHLCSVYILIKMTLLSFHQIYSITLFRLWFNKATFIKFLTIHMFFS